MTGPGDPADAGNGPAERRRTDRRRTYNRRQDDRETSPPYFEVFERIAVALENIEARLQRKELTLPDADVRARDRH